MRANEKAAEPAAGRERGKTRQFAAPARRRVKAGCKREHHQKC
jgi:hypothetical protein